MNYDYDLDHCLRRQDKNFRKRMRAIFYKEEAREEREQYIESLEEKRKKKEEQLEALKFETERRRATTVEKNATRLEQAKQRRKELAKMFRKKMKEEENRIHTKTLSKGKKKKDIEKTASPRGNTKETVVTTSSSSSGFSSDFTDNSAKEAMKQLVKQKSEQENVSIKKKASRIVEQSALLQAMQTKEEGRQKFIVPKQLLRFERGSCEDRCQRAIKAH